MVAVALASIPLALARRSGRGFLVGAAGWGFLTAALLPFLGVGLLFVPLAASYGVLARDRSSGTRRGRAAVSPAS